jgi:hypothetical protein
MASKAEKLRRKRGRPKVEDVAREPNGRITRSANNNNHREIARRAERLGLTVVQARDQKAATFIGYLNILGRVDGISDDQYEAAMKFLDLRRSYLLAIKAPNAERSDEGSGNTNSEISDSYVDWCRDTTKRYEDCRRAIQRYQNEVRQNLWAAADLCLIQGHRMHHMIGDVRTLCNALIMFFRV